jgi:RNA polymerase sigma-70 factor (ECF subfamily)
MSDSAADRDSKARTGRPAAQGSDEELVRLQQAAPGSAAGRAAAAELCERYQEQVYLWCFRRAREHEMALDLAQDVMITAYRSAGSFRGDCRYSTWLFTITRNRCARALRRPRWQRDPEVDPDTLDTSLPDAAEAYVAQAREEALLALLNTVLSPAERLAIWLRYIEGLPVDEITRRLESPLATGARGVLQTARRKLRAALPPQANGERGGNR